MEGNLARHGLLRVIPLLLLLAVGFTCPVWTQIRTAVISGMVQDDSGGVLPGVEVTVKNADTGSARQIVTDDGGRYQALNLELGGYEVEASLAGFQTAVRTGITLTVGREAVVNLILEVGEISEKVTVTGEAPLVNTTSAGLSGLVDDRTIRDLPLNGRSFDQLAQLQPGVIAFRQSAVGGASQTAGGLRITVAGARPTQTNWVLDGTNIMDSANGTPGSVTGNNLGVEAIREFEVLTSTYSAVFGGRSGGVVNIVTKSGTNEIHGSAFEFHRNDNLDARNFFDRKQPPEFKRNQFGFTLGAPIRKDRTFVFGNFEGLRERKGLTQLAIVPTALARTGVFPNETVTVNPLVKPYLALWPLPNGRDFGDGTGEFGSATSTKTDENYYTIRLDHKISDADSLFVRYTLNSGYVLIPDALLMFGSASNSRLQYVTIEEKRIFSSTLLNTVSFGFNRSLKKKDGLDLVPAGADVSFIPGQPFGRIFFTGISTAIGAVAPPTRGTLSSFAFNLPQVSDNVNYTRGAHSFQFGVNVGRLQDNFANATYQRGTYQFSSLKNLLLGQAVSFQSYTPESRAFRGMRTTIVGAYLQDDVRVRPNLTFNLGLRYQTQTAPSEVNGLQSALLDIMDPQVVVGHPYFNQPGHAFEPRIGFAWDPFSNGKTSVRGGFGIFHDILVGNFYINPAAIDAAFTKVGSVSPAPFPNAYPLVAVGGGVPTFYRVGPDSKMPTRMQYNLSFQRELFSGTVATLGYVGALGRNLTRSVEMNTPIPQILPDGRIFFPVGSTRRNPKFGSVVSAINDTNSGYNSLQLTASRRFSRGFQSQVSYTWSHSIDEASGQWGTEVRNNPGTSVYGANQRFDRGSSAFDIRHNFSFSGVWDLPWGQNLSTAFRGILGGWQVNGMLGLSSGFTVNPVVGFNRSRNLDRMIPERPNLAPGASNNPVLGGPDRYFDSTAFLLPDAGFFGDLGRGTLRGPSYANLDFGLVKNSHAGENVNIQFRAEFFNVLNRANFGRPDTTLFTSAGRRGAAGRITETLTTSRQVQFGLKIIF